MATLKVRKSKNFTTIMNEILQNPNLTYEAKGLLAELLSRPNDWKVYKSQLIRKHTKGTKLNRIFKELQQARHFRIRTIRDKNTGKITDRVWDIYEEPFTT